MRILLLLIAGAVLAVGCGAEQPGRATGQGASETTEPSATTEPSTEPSGPTVTLPSADPMPIPTASLSLQPPQPTGDPSVVPADVLEQVLADAAGRAGVARAQARAVSAQAVQWNDGSLGCPEPGREYIQVLVDGYHIMVEAGGQTLDYRTGNGAIKVCGGK